MLFCSAVSSVKLICPLLELVVSVSAVDREGHSSHQHYHSHSGYKQHWVTCQHRQFGCQVPTAYCLPQYRLVGLVVGGAPEDTGVLIVAA